MWDLQRQQIKTRLQTPKMSQLPRDRLHDLPAGHYDDANVMLEMSWKWNDNQFTLHVVFRYRSGNGEIKGGD